MDLVKEQIQVLGTSTLFGTVNLYASGDFKVNIYSFCLCGDRGTCSLECMEICLQFVGTDPLL